MKKKQGCLLVIEGIDGAGKSTQVRMLAKRLRQLGMEVAVFREPTRGKWGRKVRALAKTKKALNPKEELELFILDRQENVLRNIIPSLSSGRVVILDRYYFSTMAYQGARGIDPQIIRRRNETFAPRPEGVFILSLPAAQGVSRIQKRRQQDLLFEREKYLRKVESIFRKIKGRGIYHLDAAQAKEKIHQAIFLKTKKILQKHGQLP